MQTTEVTITVKDLGGKVWANSGYTVFAKLPFGGCSTVPTGFSGCLDGNGQVTLSVPSDSELPPGSGGWFITVRPVTSKDPNVAIPDSDRYSFTQPIGITGASKDVFVSPPSRNTVR